MTNEQILKRAIKKAKRNGWKLKHPTDEWVFRFDTGKIEDMKSPKWLMIEEESWYRIIFSHDFAKAFWGEEPEMVCEWGRKIGTGDRWGGPFPIWVYHLFQMVREKEPLKYLEKFL